MKIDFAQDATVFPRWIVMDNSRTKCLLLHNGFLFCDLGVIVDKYKVVVRFYYYGSIRPIRVKVRYVQVDNNTVTLEANYKRLLL